MRTLSNRRPNESTEQARRHTKLGNDVPLIPTPRRQLVQLVRVDEVQRRELVRLTLMLRTIIEMPMYRMPQLVRKNIPLRAGPQMRVNEDRAVIGEPQPVSGPQRTHEHINAELFRVLPRVVGAPPREPRVRDACSRRQRLQRIALLPHPTGPL